MAWPSLCADHRLAERAGSRTTAIGRKADWLKTSKRSQCILLLGSLCFLVGPGNAVVQTMYDSRDVRSQVNQILPHITDKISDLGQQGTIKSDIQHLGAPDSGERYLLHPSWYRRR